VRRASGAKVAAANARGAAINAAVPGNAEGGRPTVQGPRGWGEKIPQGRSTRQGRRGWGGKLPHRSTEMKERQKWASPCTLVREACERASS
jgi:hypothetical protein